MESDKLTNQKIAEIKKRILLAERQKTAYIAECEKQSRINNEAIATLKEAIKELSVKCGRLRNPLQCSFIIKEMPIESTNGEIKKCCNLPSIMVGKVTYPIGAKNVEEALFLVDLKITELRKRLDLVKHRFKYRRQEYDKLMKKYLELLEKKKVQEQNFGYKPSESLEEDSNRKLICQLENEIHRTNVRWIEAEYIRKKYKSIQASLMNDSESFDKSLRELEAALNEQHTEINRLQKVHSGAIEMRDAAKINLQREEHQANYSQKTRERQALDFRKQVEQRRNELEVIGRKLFFENKTIIGHQDSVTSSTRDLNTAKRDIEVDETSHLYNITKNLEEFFKNLMRVTCAVSPQEVYEHFSSQKESALRLNYLRTSFEKEKSKLEIMRETLTQELESSKFADVKEQEVHQEVIENIKTQILECEVQNQKNMETSEKILEIIKFIKERLIELIFRMQEVDETNVKLKNRNLIIEVVDLPTFLADKAEELDIIEMVKIKLDKCQQLCYLKEQIVSDDLALNISKEHLLQPLQPTKTPPNTPTTENQTLMPACYYNLLMGRTQRTIGTSSSLPEQGPVASTTTEEESEVPSRNFLKTQSAVIVDQKSRRKPFRQMTNLCGK